ncbi:hypothetical protein BDV93DRAFT_559465 [Ceratobasidium sp. AG-I]|nr:hypothetical protein BDV93DRAFT_559465 [Ceratobasidium sp. AG-I]
MASTRPAHVNDLPSEILSSIFATLVDDSLFAHSIGDDSYGSSECPTLISSVCVHWRSVAIATSFLWSYLDLMLSNHHMRNNKHVRLWLERSQSSPLRIRIGKSRQGKNVLERTRRHRFYSSTIPRNLDDQLALILTSNATRICSTTLMFTHPSLAREVFFALLPEVGEHSIRELALRGFSSTLSDGQPLLLQNKRNQLLEPLHVLHLERIEIQLGDIPCRNLVELQLINPPSFSLVELAQLLECNPGLHTIVLDELVLDDLSPPTNRSINLPSLRYVRSSEDQGFVESLLKLLAPGPHGLNLHLGYIENLTSFVDVMIPFFQRTNIESLCLQTEGEPLLPLLTSLPHLQMLRLTTFDPDGSTFAGLDSATNLLPKLHTIALDDCKSNDYSALHPGLRALLSLPSVRQIKHLKYSGPWNEDRDRERFIQLLEEGRFAATVVQASASDFEQRASPFR